MGDHRFVSTQFCDDVRQEVGNKISLMGCYGQSMLISTFPVLLPKLCAQIKAYTPLERPFAQIVLRLLRGDQALVEMRVPPETLAIPSTMPIPPEARWHMIVGVLAMSPFHVEEPCTLRVEVDTEEGTLSGGTFRIEQAPAVQTQ